MNKEWKEKWVTALRSGKYQQGQGVLRSKDDKFCCLGVLCDLFAKETGSIDWEEYGPDYAFEYCAGTLHKRVANETGLARHCDAEGDLITMNDSVNNPATFSEIADWIEKNL